MAPIERLSNKAGVYHSIYDETVELYRKEEREAAEKLARDLIAHADLPYIIKARTLMILATGPSHQVYWAELAVKEMQDLVQLLTATKGAVPQYEQDVLKEAKNLLSSTKEFAQEAADAQSARVSGEEMEVEDEEWTDDEDGYGPQDEGDDDAFWDHTTTVRTTTDELGNVIEVDEDNNQVEPPTEQTAEELNVVTDIVTKYSAGRPANIRHGLATPGSSRNPTREDPSDPFKQTSTHGASESDRR